MGKKHKNGCRLYISLIQMYSIFVINTYNESSLHRKFKIAAAEKYGGQTEQSVGPYICDAVAADGTIIEIQTGSFTHICGKLADLLKTHRVRLIYPLMTAVYLEYRGENGRLLSRRKSPVKRGIYHIFDELTALHSVLPHKNFSFEAVETSAVKTRIKTAEPVQSANKRRRRKKNWLASDTAVEKIGMGRVFRSARDYLNLLPKNLPQEFTVKDLSARIEEPTACARQINEMLWLFRKLNFVTRTGKRGNSFLYSLI